MLLFFALRGGHLYSKGFLFTRPESVERVGVGLVVGQRMVFDTGCVNRKLFYTLCGGKT